MRLPATIYESVRDAHGRPGIADAVPLLISPGPSFPTKDAAPLWAPHTRKDGAVLRRRADVELVHAIVLDYDTEDPSAYPRALDALTRSSWTWYAYRTFTHPRFRLVLPFRTAYLAKDYTGQGMAAYARALLESIGLPSEGLDKTKIAPESIFYVPSNHPPAFKDTGMRIAPPKFKARHSDEPEAVRPILETGAWPGPEAFQSLWRDLPLFWRSLLNPHRSPLESPPVDAGRRHRRVYAELRSLAPYLSKLGPSPEELTEALSPAWHVLYPEGPPTPELYALVRDALRLPDPLPIARKPLDYLPPIPQDDDEIPAIPEEDDIPPIPDEMATPTGSLGTIPALRYRTIDAFDALDYFERTANRDTRETTPIEIPATVDPLHAYHLRKRAQEYRATRDSRMSDLDESCLASTSEKGKPVPHLRKAPDHLVRVLLALPVSAAAIRYDIAGHSLYHDLACRPLTDNDEAELAIALARHRSEVVPRDLSARHLLEPLRVVAARNPVDPFLEYLEACYALYERTDFDLRRFLLDTFRIERIEDTENSIEVLHRWLRSVIARRMYGDAVHIVPIFEGNQGIGKSRSMKILFGSNYTSDLMTRDWANKDTIITSMGSVVVEIPELNGISPDNLDQIEALKGFITSETDTLRLPHDRRRTQARRTFSLYATTNRSEGYIPQDRRFAPMSISYVDQAALLRFRDVVLGKLYGEVIARDSERYPTYTKPDEPLAAWMREQSTLRSGAPWWVGHLEGALYEYDEFRRIDRTKPRYRNIPTGDLSQRVSDASKREIGTAKVGQVVRQYLSEDWEIKNHGGRPMAVYRGTFPTTEDKMKQRRVN